MADTEQTSRRTGPHAPLPSKTITLSGVPEIADAPVDDSLARAKARAAELRSEGTYDEDQGDKFYIDPAIIPPGWSYEWRVHSVFGKVDTSYQIELAQKGWQPVPASRHPQLMPAGYGGGTIDREGQVLMERPLEITEEAKARERGKARKQMRDKEEQLAGAPPGTFDRDNKGNKLVTIKKEFAHIPMSVPKE
jgi:hypothetical protein